MAVAIERFRQLATTDETVSDMVRKLNFIFNNLATGGTAEIGDKEIKAGNIDFGITSTQVKASNIPIVDADNVYTAGQVEAALTEVMQKLISATMTVSFMTATITTSWSGTAPYTQEVEIEGVFENGLYITKPVYSETLLTAVSQKTAWKMISDAVPLDGKIVFKCFEEKPTTAIPILIGGFKWVW